MQKIAYQRTIAAVSQSVCFDSFFI